jgi:hypothetical protein
MACDPGGNAPNEAETFASGVTQVPLVGQFLDLPAEEKRFVRLVERTESTASSSE